MRDSARVPAICGVFVCALVGGVVRSYLGMTAGLLIGLACLAIPFRGQTAWSWLVLYAFRNRGINLRAPITAISDRSSGGVRYQGGVAAVAVQVLGKRHKPTFLLGAHGTQTANRFDLALLVPMMRHSLGLQIDSISVVRFGARRSSAGDYPRVYDTMIGTHPYAGRRETWLVLRINSLANGDALRWRTSAGAAAVAAAQRIAADLRSHGIRARIASASDVVELDRKLGISALEPYQRRWHTLRGESGWMTTYTHHPSAIGAESVERAWTLRVDSIMQNITIFADGGACASTTVYTPQPPTAAPSIAFETLPGEQARALANSMCGPRTELRGQRIGRLPESLEIEVGPSGVLLGKRAGGDRFLLPLADPCDATRVHLMADDPITKRLIIRASASGERITVHTIDTRRWESVRMPNVVITDKPRPAAGTTISVLDGNCTVAPRPQTLILLGSSIDISALADVEITQTGPGVIEVGIDGVNHELEVELFRAENRYTSASLVPCR